MNNIRAISQVIAMLVVTVFIICAPFATMDLLGGNEHPVIAGLGGAAVFCFLMGCTLADAWGIESGPCAWYAKFRKQDNRVNKVMNYLFAH